MTQQHSPWRTVLIAGVVAIVGLGAVGTIGVAQARGAFHGMWGGGMWGHGPGFGGPMLGSVVDHALGAVDASDAQRADIRGIVDAAGADIGKLTADVDGLREQATTLLRAETLDRAAFEALRQQALTTGDAVSARALEAFLDAAEILAPDQRAKLLEQQHGFGPRFGRR